MLRRSVLMRVNSWNGWILRRWIQGGAEYRGHWAFDAPQRPPVPVVADATWPRNDIDRFVHEDTVRHRAYDDAPVPIVLRVQP